VIISIGDINDSIDGTDGDSSRGAELTIRKTERTEGKQKAGGL